MNDTPPHVDEMLRQMYAQRSPDERIRMAASMFDCAKIIARGSIERSHPEASEAEIRVLLFRRLYGNDFDASQRAKIEERIVQWCDSADARAGS